MLVLSRKQSETITIGSDIVVKVMQIKGGRVRIAIDAPDHVRIMRGEIVGSTVEPAREIVVSGSRSGARDQVAMECGGLPLPS